MRPLRRPTVVRLPTPAPARRAGAAIGSFGRAAGFAGSAPVFALLEAAAPGAAAADVVAGPLGAAFRALAGEAAVAVPPSAELGLSPVMLGRRRTGASSGEAARAVGSAAPACPVPLPCAGAGLAGFTAGLASFPLAGEGTGPDRLAGSGFTSFAFRSSVGGSRRSGSGRRVSVGLSGKAVIHLAVRQW